MSFGKNVMKIKKSAGKTNQKSSTPISENQLIKSYGKKTEKQGKIH